MTKGNASSDCRRALRRLSVARPPELRHKGAAGVISHDLGKKSMRLAGQVATPQPRALGSAPRRLGGLRHAPRSVARTPVTARLELCASPAPGAVVSLLGGLVVGRCRSKSHGAVGNGGKTAVRKALALDAHVAPRHKIIVRATSADTIAQVAGFAGRLSWAPGVQTIVAQVRALARRMLRVAAFVEANCVPAARAARHARGQ